MLSTLKRTGLALGLSLGMAAMIMSSGVASATSLYQNLVWSDEFNTGTTLNSSKWNYNTGGGGWGNGELQNYTSNQQNVRLSNGQLIIQASYNAKRNTYTSGRILTAGKYSMQYGRVDVRAELPTGVGSWPAIWMLPAGAKYGSQYLANGEIDIMEEVGAVQNQIVGSAHSLAYNPSLGTTRHGIYNLAGANTGFHTYSLEWSPDYLSYQIDGVEYYRVLNDHTGYQSWPYDQPFYLIINLAVGGSWGGYKGVDTSSMPWQLKVDYVHIYQ